LIIYLNNSKVISKAQLSKGGITGTLVDVRIVLKLRSKWEQRINFMSQSSIRDFNPSDADKQITKN
jgi:DNA repair protein RadC